LNKINWFSLSSNTNIFELDLLYLKSRMNIIREELMMKVYNPIRLEKYLNMDYDIGNDEYI